MEYFIYLAIMALSTYLIRAVPFALVRKKIENRFLRSFLYYIPYAVLTAMTFPAILSSTATVLSGAAALVVAVILFFGVSYTFYAPQFEGRSLAQGDIAQYAGMSQDIREHREATGEDPQWTGNMFSGMPAYLIDVEYPTQDVKQTVGSVVKVVDGPMNMTLFAMIMMMVAVVLMGVNPWIGIIAGLAYGLSTYFLIIIDFNNIK